MKNFKQLLLLCKAHRKKIISLIILIIFTSILSNVRPVLTKMSVDEYIIVKDFKGLLYLGIAIIILLILEGIVQLLFVYNANTLGQGVVVDVRNDMMNKLLWKKKSFFDTTSVGVFITRLGSDTEKISEIFSNGLFNIINDSLKVIILWCIMFYQSWQLSLIVCIMLPITLYFTRLFQKKMKQAFEAVRKHVARLNSFVEERLYNIKIVKLFGRETIEEEKFKSINADHRDAWLKTVKYNSIFLPFVEFISSVTIGLVIWYGGLRIILQENDISIGTLFLFIQLIQMMFAPLRQIADKFSTLQMGLVAVDRVSEILAHQDQEIMDQGIPFKGLTNSIVFDKVSFGYAPDQLILKNLSFTIQKGDNIAIVGKTGSGKSTLINLINGFYQPTAGQITMDGIPLNDYTLNSLRSSIYVIPQDVFLFSDTIMNNIRLKDLTISDEAIYSAAERIGIHDFICSLPDQYSFNVKERGALLSTGQRQLIGFLRAYLRQTEILIMDEATSSVDSYTEELIQRAVELVSIDKTTITIAHRASSIKHVSKKIELGISCKSHIKGVCCSMHSISLNLTCIILPWQEGLYFRAIFLPRKY